MLLLFDDKTYSYKDQDTYSFGNISDINQISNLSKFILSPQSSYVFENDVIPPGLLHVSDNLVVYEKPPVLKNIFFVPQQLDAITDSSEQQIYTLPLPWQVYFVNYSSYYDEDTGTRKSIVSDVYMYFSMHPARHSFTDLYLPPLPNFYANGLLCRPMFNNMEDVTRYPNTLAGIISSSYDWVWNSGTNADLTEALLQPIIQSSTPFANTVLKHANPALSQYCDPSSSFYSSNIYSTHLFNSWQSISLDDILTIEFPSPVPDFSQLRYMPFWQSLFNQNIQDYFSDNPHLISDSSLCCEDCQYYDEDGDIIEGECTEEGHCSCHQNSFSNLSSADRYKVIRNNPQAMPLPYTYSDTLDKIISLYPHSPHSLSPTFLQDISDNICLSS